MFSVVRFVIYSYISRKQNIDYSNNFHGSSIRLTGYLYTVTLDGQTVEPDTALEPASQEVQTNLPQDVKVYKDSSKYR